jgi:hypothetical protein
MSNGPLGLVALNAQHNRQQISDDAQQRLFNGDSESDISNSDSSRKGTAAAAAVMAERMQG